MSALGRAKSLAKSALANPRIRAAYNGATRAVLNVAGSSRLGATLYSVPGFLTFNREQWSILSGRRAYYRNLKRTRTNHVELRRNIHRLEKGLQMQPRRDVFALDYIDETLDFYEAAAARSASAVVDAGEMQWAHDVLEEYFATVSRDEAVVSRAAARFAAVPTIENHAVRPYQQRELERTDIAYEQMLHLAQSRRSIRWFQDRAVPRELIDKALLVGRQAPSACNRLPYEFLVFDTPDEVARVGSIPFGAAGYSHQIPTLIAVKGDQANYFSPRDRHTVYIDASLAVMGFVFALETLGLSSSIINWPDFEPLEARMAKELALKPHERIVMLVAVGYPDPDALVAYSKKKDIESIRTFHGERDS